MICLFGRPFPYIFAGNLTIWNLIGESGDVKAVLTALMADTEASPQENGGSGWMGRAFGKVMGMFTPSANAQKMMDLLPEDADDDLAVRRQDKKRGREEYVAKEEESEREEKRVIERLWKRNREKGPLGPLSSLCLRLFTLILTL